MENKKFENNKVSLITGASRGIGKAIALQLANDGYDVAFCYKSNHDAAKEVADEIEKLGRKILYRDLDISDLSSVRNFIEEVENSLGPISVIINNAGIVNDKALALMDENTWSQVIDINLTSVYNICRSIIYNFMKRRNGVILNISSAAGIYGNSGQVNYCASKAGIIGFTKALAKEVGSYGIRVNAIAPGFIETEMTSTLSPKKAEEYKNQITLRRFGSVNDVSNIVSFMISDKATYITGQTIQIDGGIVM